MANIVRFNTTSTGPQVTFMTTGLIVANNTLSPLSSVTQVQSSQLRIYADLELLVGSTAAAFSLGGYVTVYKAPKMDGTNTVEQDRAELEPWTVCPVTTSTTNAQHRVYRSNLVCPISDFNVLIDNQTGQTLTTGGGDNTLKIAFYDLNNNA